MLKIARNLYRRITSKLPQSLHFGNASYKIFEIEWLEIGNIFKGLCGKGIKSCFYKEGC